MKRAAELAGVSPGTLRRWAQAGLIPELGGAGRRSKARGHRPLSVDQDVVGHMEEELDDAELGRVRVAIAFADLPGYTRFTEKEGEEKALSSVERFVEEVTATLPEDARVVKTIGIHFATTIYRNGDYFGRDINLASRVVARARGGEVLVTDSVVHAVRDSPRLGFEGIGQVKMKGFKEPRRLCRAIPRLSG